MTLLNQIMKPILFSFLLFLLFSQLPVHAQPSFPRGCEVVGFGFSNSELVLNESGAQAYYLIQNRTESTIELEHHTTEQAFMSPPLQAKLDATSWAAFASDIKNLHFKCYKRSGENDISTIDCRDALDVCQYPRVRFALSNMGNYWISANKSQNEVIQDSVTKGIYLKW